MDTDVSFGTWVRRRRRALDLTQHALAQRIGCARITIQKIEAGERRPSREFAALLAERLAVPLDERAAFLRAARSELATQQLADPIRPATNIGAFRQLASGARVLAIGNVPTRLTPCIGRERELAQLAALVADPNCHLITVIGLGGVGKTCLAITAATAHADTFADGAWFVALTTLESAELAAVAIADVLGVARNPEADPLKQLTFFLRDRQLLLILDNAEHIAPGATTLLVRLLGSAPGLKVIVTSRERLRLQGEWLIELDGLDYPQVESDTASETAGAVQLFAYHARMARPDVVLGPQERPHVARLCRILEGLPLAIELAAGWVRMYPCQTIAEQIAHGLDVGALAPRDLPERQRSLRTVFNYSWGLLDQNERAGLRRLAAFHSPFDPTAAAAVADAPLALVAALLDKSLLRHRDDEHFELHGLMRQYAAERLAEVQDEQERTLARHAAHFAALANALGAFAVVDAPVEIVEAFSASLADVRAAWEWATARRETALVAQMMDGFRVFFEHQGLYHEGVDLFGRAALAFEAIERTDAAVDRLVSRLRVRQAIFYDRLAMTEQARHLLQAALAVARAASDQPEIAHCLEDLAGVAWAQGAYREAQHYAEEALGLHEALGDELAASMIQSMLGGIAHDLGEYDVARQLCQTAFDAAARVGSNGWRMAAVTIGLGYVEYALGNYPTARTLIEAAVAAAEDTGRTYGVTHLQSILGLILAAQGEWAAAERALRAALGRARLLNYPFGIALALNRLGAVLSWQGAYTEAQALLNEALSLCEAAENRTGIAYALVRLGELACATGDVAQAEHLLRRALKTAAAIESTPLILDVLASMALLAARRGQDREALQLLALPLGHPANRAVTRERAAQLHADIVSRLPSNVSVPILESGHDAELATFIKRLLDPRAE
jgi:predicted ATPase/transcriptional regulator with XRE-family HTH domain/Tfp pilus assembly protein PilF